jgi:hypothetical protein
MKFKNEDYVSKEKNDLNFKTGNQLINKELSIEEQLELFADIIIDEFLINLYEKK